MDGKILALLIVAIVFGTGLIQKKLKVDEAKAKRGDGEETKALKAQVAALEERVRVLERIATDKKERLREEIDAL